jgi:hypothetical protein
MRFKALTVVVLLAAAGLATTSYARPSISTQTMPGVNFSSYKTYSWAHAAIPQGMSPISFQLMVKDFDAALAAKGYQKTASDGDLSLILTVGAREKTDVQSWGRFGMQTSVYQYTQGQVSLDAFDSKTAQAVWHGQASETVNPQKPNDKAINAAVARMMEKFPAGGSQAVAAPPPSH